MKGWDVLSRSWRLSSLFLDAGNAVMAQHHLHSKSLMVLGAYQNMTQPTEVSRYLRVPMPTLSNIHRELERYGYLAKKHDPIDRRRQIVSITQKGQNVYSLCINEINMAFESKRKELTNEDVLLAISTLENLAKIMECELVHRKNKKTKS